MHRKKSRTIALGSAAPTSRRDFLRYGGVVIGTSIVASSWPRWAAAQSASFDYYISPSGSDSNPGTQSQPWAITSLVPGSPNRSKMAGHRVGVLPGTYHVIAAVGGSTNNSFSSPVLDVPPGSSGSPTILQSTTPLGAILDGGLTDSNAPNRPPLLGHVNPGDGYYTIDGFEVRNANDRLISVGGGTGAGSAANCSGVVVKNCYCHHIVSTSVGSNSTGITAYALNGGLIQNNFVTDVVNSTNRNTGIETWSCQNTVIEYNTVVMSNGGAGAIFIKNAGQRNIAIRYNYCDLSGSANDSNAVIAWDLGGSSSDTSSLHHNIIIGAQVFTVGIMTGGPDSVEHQQIYNNTFVGNPGFNPGGVRPWGASGVLTHYNNVYSRTSVGGRGDLDVNAGSLTLTDYNLFPSSPQLGITPSGSMNYPTTYSSLSAWASALPSGCTGKDAHSVVGAAGFVGGSPTYPAQKYQLASSSLGKGSGSTNGQASGSPCDMGAWGGASPPARVGCSFVPGLVAPPAVPDAPVLSVT